ncbi:hypothetical protein J2Y45_000428 [Dyadobacter sp. BE34]|uniref:Ig-like domain-containing protein n=1 Tax=Dyadobacter fermentans TaxID=94254 RepID=A0ABU1QPT2_9BACT|nr:MULTISPECIES: T9SS type A sorting domain-containing protein [Dyadobacter]MDR6803158.1 hypothetical protein [Dyadobacter fermentans]MDR7040899.1 hypothetical protein [Dyadobacter sp. BE242]MDR7195302.1 hypothetical protein [Dyadobacter sp. BE34]MDR7214152.1 hypothetical protein [Dyadobacter sp. BE31]MDR7260709.1 hypothetical protein [Dyadobacter sp. BE32]
MKRTFIKESFLTIFATLFCLAASFGQTTITTGAVTPTSVCAGSDVSVAFTFTGTPAANTDFIAQLSDAAGAFGLTPTEIGSAKTSPITATIPGGTTAGAAYKIRVISRIALVLQVTGSPSDALTVNAVPAAPTVVTPVNYTKGATATALSATPNTGLLWYNDATGGTGSATAPTPITTTPGTTSYWVSQKPGACESPRAKIDVVVTCPPVAKPTVVSPVNYVTNQTATPLQATVVSGATRNWYGTSATGGTASPAAPTPSTNAVGTTSYYVSQTVDGCESERAKIDVVVTACPPPAKPTVVTPVNYVVNTTATPLQATFLSGATHNWYGPNATGGTASPDATVPETDAVGTTSYYVSQTVSGCESERAKIDVVVTACTPSAKPGVADVEFCLNGPTTPLTATGTNLKWYNSDGTALASAPKPSSASAGVTSYFVTQRVPPGCESAKAEIKVTIRETPAPTATSPVEYCLNETATPLTATGSGLKWYMSSSGGTGTTTAPTPITTAVGTTRYYVSQTVNGCESVQRKEVAVVVKNFSTAPTVTASVNLCQNSSPAALTANGTGLKWYTTSSGGTALDGAPVPVTTAVGTTNYYVSQTSAGLCEGPRAKIEVVIKDTPAAPAVTPLDYCVGAKPLPLTPSGAVYKWYNGPTGGTGTTTAPTPTATTAGTTSYYVTQSNTYGTLTCESPRAKLDVTVNATPAALAPFSEALCQERSDKNYTFPTQASAGNTLKWYTAATGGNANTTAPTINLKEAKETIYYVTQSSAKGCESTTRVSQKILVKPLPGLPGISQSLIEYCQFIAAKPLEATPSANATLDWYGTNASGGSASPNAPTPSTAEGGTTSYYVGQTLAGCAGDRAKIDVKVNTTPKPATKTYLEYCQNEVAPVLDATGTILKWYRGANDTDFQGVPFTPFTEKVQDYSFYVTQTGSNGCESPKEEIKIHIKSLPSATISGNPTIDLGQTATINIKFTGDGPWIYILSSGLTDTTDQADHQVQVKPSTTTSYLLTEVSNACGKGTINGLAVVTVKVPTINSGSPSVSEICASKAFTVPFQQSGDFPAGNTFKLQVAKENVDAKFYTIASTATANSVSATFPDTTKGGTYFVRVISSGTNPDFTVKGSVSSITINVSPLPVATLTGTQTILVGESANLKADITGKAPWTITLNNGTKDTLITANATPFNFKLAPKTTTTYAITKVTNGCGVGTGVGTARVQVDPILGVEPPAPADWAKVYPTVINGKCTVEVTGTISPKQAKIEVVDLNGRPRSTQVIKQQKTEVDFANYPSGLYLLRIQNGNLSTVQRVMKP